MNYLVQKNKTNCDKSETKELTCQYISFYAIILQSNICYKNPVHSFTVCNTTLKISKVNIRKSYIPFQNIFELQHSISCSLCVWWCWCESKSLSKCIWFLLASFASSPAFASNVNKTISLMDKIGFRKKGIFFDVHTYIRERANPNLGIWNLLWRNIAIESHNKRARSQFMIGARKKENWLLKTPKRFYRNKKC